MTTSRIRSHEVQLRSSRLVLRPMSDADIPVLLPWNQDAEVLYYAEGNDESSKSVEDMVQMYSVVSNRGRTFCFIIELDGRPIGECWLQEMNLPYILEAHAGLDCRRIDLMIGEKSEWGKGYGTEAIGRLVEFGFREDGADLIFGCGIADYNVRSRRAFERVGFAEHAVLPEPEGAKAACRYDMAIARSDWAARRSGGSESAPGVSRT